MFLCVSPFFNFKSFFSFGLKENFLLIAYVTLLEEYVLMAQGLPPYIQWLKSDFLAYLLVPPFCDSILMFISCVSFHLMFLLNVFCIFMQYCFCSFNDFYWAYISMSVISLSKDSFNHEWGILKSWFGGSYLRSKHSLGWDRKMVSTNSKITRHHFPLVLTTYFLISLSVLIYSFSVCASRNSFGFNISSSTCIFVEEHL